MKTNCHKVTAMFSKYDVLSHEIHMNTYKNTSKSDIFFFTNILNDKN